MEAIVKQRQAEINASIAREEASLAAITESLESGLVFSFYSLLLINIIIDK